MVWRDERTPAMQKVSVRDNEAIICATDVVEAAAGFEVAVCHTIALRGKGFMPVVHCALLQESFQGHIHTGTDSESYDDAVRSGKAIVMEIRQRLAGASLIGWAGGSTSLSN